MTAAATTMLVIVLDRYLASTKSLEVGVVDGMVSMVVRWKQRCVGACVSVVRRRWHSTNAVNEPKKFPG